MSSVRQPTQWPPLRCVYWAGFYSLVPNVPYWIACRLLQFLPHGAFCLEFALVGVIGLFTSRVSAAIVLMAIIVADLLCGACESYFLTPQQFIINLTELHSFSLHRQLVILAVGILALVIAAIGPVLPAPRDRKQRLQTVTLLVVFALTIASEDLAAIILKTGHFPSIRRVAMVGDGFDRVSGRPIVPRLARIPIARLIRSELTARNMHVKETAPAARLVVFPGAFAQAVPLALSGEKAHFNLVLVLVESWGLPRDPRVDQALVEPYETPEVSALYQVTQGTVGFDGGTVPGESRELCGNHLAYHLLYASADELRGCVPGILHAQGYHNVAVHGMNGNMFSRSSWYEKIGFQEEWFNQQFRESGMPDCIGAFVGTCDSAVAGWIGKRLQENDDHPLFVYWVTLDSHLPVPIPTTLPNPRPCSSDLAIQPNSPLCSWFQLVANVHQSISRVAVGRLDRPTIFVIVGDHAPPFGNRDVRSRFSATEVPFVMLVPRGATRPSQRSRAPVN
jgi:sulfatase-like protein